MFIAVVYIILLIIRIPILINADAFLTADEGFIASDMLDLLNGGPFSLSMENVSYEGVIPQLTAVPFFWIFGISSLTFKLPGIFFYAIYIWTFYLLIKKLNSKIAWVSVFLLIFCPPVILNLSTLNYSYFIVASMGNAAYFIYFKNRENPSRLKVFYITYLIGLSLYTNLYSVIYLSVLFILWIMDTRVSLRKVLQSLKPTSSREYCARFIDIAIILNVSWILLSFIAGGVSIKLGDFNLFNSFMKGTTPHYLALNSNKINIPLIELLYLIPFFRLIIYRDDFIRAIQSIKNSDSIRLWGIGLFGFLIGLTPRWIALYEKSISGHPGFELDIALSKMWLKLSDLVFEQIPKIFELNSYSGILVSLLIVIAIFNFLRREKSEVEMVFAILPIVILLASVIYQKPNVVRHLFPLHGAIVFYLASFLFYVEKKSVYSFWLILVFWGTFYSYTSYDYYKSQNIMTGYSILKKDTDYHNLIKYAREKNFEAVYTGYWAHKLNFLSGGNPLFVEFYSNPFQGWKRLEKAIILNDFAVLIPDNKNLKIYETYIKIKNIDCNRENIQGHIILSGCRGKPYEIRELRLIGQ
jgi:hypothetical protein